ncbi:esterase/lipase, putative [Pelodictyon luteolum DSM 273]|uniref:Esterase/lipase, putative n=2 Tax=Pelodictyon luteolum TaxID=1100 RepID=Q3B1B1_CHLL3|nr:esterase/lipase, putative [Pelodictyon luteolum DSM 273]
MIPVTIGGRTLLRPSGAPTPAGYLVGFHGYGGTAEDELRLLSSIPGSDRWTLLSIEALHPVILRDGGQGSSWMTSRDRLRRIEENVGYVDGVLDALAAGGGASGTIVFHGFSQGAAMAVRAALHGRRPPVAVMLLGGDIPPDAKGLGGMGRVHLGRGFRDRLYTEEKCNEDRRRLRDAGVRVDFSAFIGGHGPGVEYLRSAGAFLSGCVQG